MNQSDPTFTNTDDLELLSAYIDQQLTAEEQALLEQRLVNDSELRRTLNELRGTVTLLRELPAVRPPRSFTLDPAVVQPRRSWFGNWMQLGALVTSLLLVVSLTPDLLGLFAGGSQSTPPSAAVPYSAETPAAKEAPVPMQAPAAPMVGNAEVPTSVAAAAPTAAPAAAQPAATAAPAATAPPEATPPPAVVTVPEVPTEVPLAGSMPATGTEASDAAQPTADPSMAAGANQSQLAPTGELVPPGSLSVGTPDAVERSSIPQESQPPTFSGWRVLQIALALLAVGLGIAALVARRRQR
jgi:hypothetical protein